MVIPVLRGEPNAAPGRQGRGQRCLQAVAPRGRGAGAADMLLRGREGVMLLVLMIVMMFEQ